MGTAPGRPRPTLSRPLVVVLLVPLVGLLAVRARASGDEDVARAAGAVSAAFAAGDTEALQILAAEDEPDPWLVVGRLVESGSLEAAKAFSLAGVGEERAALARWLEAGVPGPAAWTSARALCDRASTLLDGGDVQGALDALGAPSADTPDPYRIEALGLLAEALLASGRPREAARALAEGMSAAAGIGWSRPRRPFAEALGIASRAAANAAFTRADGGDLRGAIVDLASIPLPEDTDAELSVRILEGTGICQLLLGRVRDAILSHSRAVDLCRRSGDALGLAVNQGYLAMLRVDLGDDAGAKALFATALAGLPADAPLGTRAQLLGNQGVARLRAADGIGAEAILRRVLDLFGPSAPPADRVRAHVNLGHALHLQGRHKAALAEYAAARGITAEDRVADVVLAVREGEALAALEQDGDAARAFEAGLEGARSVGMLREEVLCRLGRCRLARRAGEDGRAVGEALAALASLPGLVGGMSFLEGAGARGVHEAVYEEGVLAALRVGRAEAAVPFLEAGRAGSLLEGLRPPEDFREVVLRPHLARALQEAEEDLTLATKRLSTAQSGDRATRRSWRKRQDEALRALGEARARVTTEQRAAANLLSLHLLGLAELKAALAPGEALLLYLQDPQASFVVGIRSKGAEWVHLAPAAEIEAEIRSAVTGAKGGLAPKEREALRARLFPEGVLHPSDRRVLVSPDGALFGVPFAALLPDRDVGIVPSGTAYAVLRSQTIVPGDHVLSLGDVDAAHARLPPLPGSRDEATEVGGELLLGPDATEGTLRKRLASREGWRIVHLACHGVVDAAQPLASALVLTPDATPSASDGWLRGVEILGMRVPAELVVLSACDVGGGALLPGEGPIGLVQAFLLGGARRVLANLWPADDDATRVLMREFHRLLRSGEAKGPGEALRRAQAHVREAKPAWADPYYWAGWVLWGPP